MQNLIINSVKAAREKERYAGQLEISALPRLLDMMQSVGRLDYCVEGSTDAQNRAHLHVAVSGLVRLQCQRCMGELEYPLQTDSVLRLASAAELAAGLDEEALTDPLAPDCIEASSALDLAALVEDEVLLALPDYPRHEAGCSSEKAVPGTASDKHSAFSVLATLAALRQK